MPQIRITNKTKKMLDAELKKQKNKARELGEPLPAMATIVEVIILEALGK